MQRTIVSGCFRLSRLLLPHWFRLLGATAFAAAACALGLGVPLLIERLLTTAGTRRDLTSLVVPGALLLAAVTLQAAAASGNTWLLGGLAIELVRSLRRQLYERLQWLPIAWFDRTPAGSIISRVTDDVSAIQTLASGQTLVTLLEVLTALAATTWLWSRSWRLGLVVCAILPIYVAVFRLFGRRIRRGTMEVREQLDHVFSHLKQKIDGIQIVRATATEAAEIARFTEQIAALHEPRLCVSRLAIGFSNLCLLLSGIGATLLFTVGVLEVQADRLTIGQLIAATVLCGLIFAPITRLSELASAYQQASASLARVGEILDQPTAAGPSCISQRPDTTRSAAGAIEFQNVSFRYAAGRPVLRNVSLCIEPGSRVAIVGPTGSGKTTLMNLLLRFYEPTGGHIRLAGRRLNEFAEGDLRQLVGIVPQEPVIFRATLADNIRYGALQAEGAAVEAAARAALVEPIARKLPQGFDTLIGEGGHPLSQGERQLIALARLFCKNPQIIVLDEATSALDPRSEALVQETLGRLLAGRTTMVIAHRLATVLTADQIVVMHEGQIIQQGTHGELWLDEAGLYRQLCNCQFAAHEREPIRQPFSAQRGQPRPYLESIFA